MRGGLVERASTRCGQSNPHPRLIPPLGAGDAQTLAMPYDEGEDRYELDFNGFVANGVYRVVYSARDIRGRVSLPAESRVTTAGPYVSAMYPGSGMGGIPQNTKIFFTLEDASSDINLDTLTVDVVSDGWSGTLSVSGGDCTATGTLATEQSIRCDATPYLSTAQPLDAAGWGLLEEVEVTINVANEAGAPLVDFVYPFTITDSIDLEGDGLPEDFQEILEPWRAPDQDTDQDGLINQDEYDQGENPIEVFPGDAYEVDDTAQLASDNERSIGIDEEQLHNFHDSGDEDWIEFQCMAHTIYEVTTFDLGPRSDTVLEIRLADGGHVIRFNDDYGLTSPESRVVFPCDRATTLFIRVTQFDRDIYGAETDYWVTVVADRAGLGAVYGRVTDAVNGAAIPSAQLELDIGVDVIADVPYPDGAYAIDTLPGSGYQLIARAEGYLTAVLDDIDVPASSDGWVLRDIALQPDLVFADTDGDGIPDDWEIAHGLDPLVADADEDPDGDGLSNLDEYINNTDPLVSNAPTAPVIASPLDGEDTGLLPTLTVFNATDIDSSWLVYHFTVTSDDGATVIEESEPVPQGLGQTSWELNVILEDDTWYRWQVRASDGEFDGPSVTARFHAVAGDQPPTTPELFAPDDGAWVDTVRPTLEVIDGFDVDLRGHRFEVYSDTTLTTLVTASTVIAPTAGAPRTAWVVDVNLTDQTDFWWRAQAEDETDRTSSWTDPFAFRVDTTNALPAAPTFVVPATDGELLVENPPTLVVQGVVQDDDGDSVQYRFRVDVDRTHSTPLATEQIVSPDSSGVASFTLPAELTQPEYWVWVAGTDGHGYGEAAEISFHLQVATELDAPEIIGPTDLAAVHGAPTLEASPVADPFGRVLTYEIELFEDIPLEKLVASTAGVEANNDRVSWTPEERLTNFQVYAWRVRAVTDDGTEGPWSQIALFYIEDGGAPGRGCHCASSGSGLLLGILAVACGMLRKRRRT